MQIQDFAWHMHGIYSIPPDPLVKRAFLLLHFLAIALLSFPLGIWESLHWVGAVLAQILEMSTNLQLKLWDFRVCITEGNLSSLKTKLITTYCYKYARTQRIVSLCTFLIGSTREQASDNQTYCRDIDIRTAKYSSQYKKKGDRLRISAFFKH